MTSRSRGAHLPLPLLYLGSAHVSLGLATLLAALWPGAVAGFFYHSWMVAIVHLVTLGWITFSILGAAFIVGPLALRMDMRARRGDYAAYALALIGLIGMVGHFWIQEYGGMAWSAGAAAVAVFHATARIAGRVRHAHLQRPVKLHIALACANFWLAASMGTLVAYDKVAHVLPGFVLSNVFAHAHLAAVGWATMMVVGVGYRLLPMTFPSRVPTGRSMYASTILLEAGVLGLFFTLLVRSRWSLIFGACIVAGLIVFVAHVVWMLRHRRKKPASAPRVDFGVLHTAGAAVWLVAAMVAGIALLVANPSPQALHVAAAYGVFGLIGFLGQMVVAMEVRLVPIATWFWAYARSGYRVEPRSPHAMRDRSLQTIVFAAWTFAVPALASGMYAESARMVAAGAWVLFAGVAIATIDNAFVIARAASAAPAPTGPPIRAARDSGTAAAPSAARR